MTNLVVGIRFLDALCTVSIALQNLSPFLSVIHPRSPRLEIWVMWVFPHHPEYVPRRLHLTLKQVTVVYHHLPGAETIVWRS